ncbi:MAG TPA: type II secretion system F family protein [Pirellulaceae bacterium]|nr:type II secretion system F family protein [Pirellulaceae bacterium]
MSGSWLLILIAFFMAVSLAGVVGLYLSGRDRRLESRLLGLAGTAPVADKGENASAIAAAVKRALPKVGQSLMPEDEGERSKLRARLVLAGLYSPQALVIYLGVKMVLMVAPALIGLFVGSLGLFPLIYGVLIGACASIFGSIGPSFWLDRKKAQRQTMLRRALPDACDLIVICMEGGLSLTGALRRVVGELRTAHPLLADELNIVQRKVQLGEPLAAALTSFATRCDLQEMRSLASVVKSAEKFGSSMVKALQNYAESLRVQRQQRAEEMAQKAATKVLFPTLMFIFPSILIIILGPAAIKMAEVLGGME